MSNRNHCVFAAFSIALSVFSGASAVQGQGVLELSDLNGSNGVYLNGSFSQLRTGWSISDVGDFNGDNIADVIIGAAEANSSDGRAYVVYGGENVGTATPINLSFLDGPDGFVVSEVDVDDMLGTSVSSAGDVNGDGFDDVIISANNDIDDDPDTVGENYVIFGTSEIFSNGDFFPIGLNGSNGFTISGIQGSNGSKTSVSCAGDVNGDGFDDLIVGNSNFPGPTSSIGRAYVLFGSPEIGSEGTIDLLDPADDPFLILEGNGNARAGASVSSAGDFNLDGYDDLLIGGAGGSVYLVFGRDDLASLDELELAFFDGSTGFRLTDDSGGTAGLGNAVSCAGDVNGDGFDDIILGANLASPNGSSLAGVCYIIFGGENVGAGGLFSLSTLDGSNGFVFSGLNESDRLGRAVSAAGDFNGDGFGDFIALASGADPNGSLSGAAYLIFGGPLVGTTGLVDLSQLDGKNGFVCNGVAQFDQSRSGLVSSAGDFNNDGFDDVLISAPDADGNAFNSGQSYLIFGGAGSFLLGDVNLDGIVSLLDVAPFVDLLTTGSFQAEADINGDGEVSLLDVAPFVDLLTGS